MLTPRPLGSVTTDRISSAIGWQAKAKAPAPPPKDAHLCRAASAIVRITGRLGRAFGNCARLQGVKVGPDVRVQWGARGLRWHFTCQ